MCLDGDYDDPPRVEHASTPTARKEHRCSECSRIIAPGERYWRWAGLDYCGDPFVSKMCAHCRATIDLGVALTGCPRFWFWEQIHELDPDDGGFVGDILANHELSIADTVRMLRRVVQRRRQWRRPNGELYPLPQIPVAA